MKKIFAFIASALSGIALNAEVILPPVLGNNMVLMQQSEVMLWGKANPESRIRINTSWDGRTYRTVAGSDGRFEVKIKTAEAGGPYRITFNDGQTTALENIMLGEVWFCSGQSNMEMPMQGFDGCPVEGFNEAMVKADARIPVRMFLADVKDGEWTKVVSKTPMEECEGSWRVNTPENAAQTSAVAYFFATRLQEVLNVPVGVIVASHGGSWIETWMDRKTIKPFSHPDMSDLDKDGPVADPYRTPTVLFNSKLYPFFKYSVRGMLWFQGENNCANPEMYSKLLPAYVKMLRERWQETLPFYYVQVTPFHSYWGSANSGGRLRENQYLGGLGIPDCGMVCTADLGDYHYIHFPRKAQVAERLLWWALAKTYGKSGIWCESPSFKSLDIKDGKAYVSV
ncbi:MAG: sialate O-acetylesterase, partial [Candidatus Cryptobacteroides sp.]